MIKSWVGKILLFGSTLCVGVMHSPSSCIGCATRWVYFILEIKGGLTTTHLTMGCLTMKKILMLYVYILLLMQPSCSFIVRKCYWSTKGETFQTRGNINVFLEELQKVRAFWSFDKMHGLQMRSHLDLKTRAWKPYWRGGTSTIDRRALTSLVQSLLILKT
jgi:hypothetical protein